MPKVLVVDDSVMVRRYHRSLVESIGFEAEEAVNGVEALEKATATPVDLFLVDVNMPLMDGYRLTEAIRSHSSLWSIPVILISTEAELEDRQRALAAGANLYLVKPTRPELLQPYVLLMAGGSLT